AVKDRVWKRLDLILRGEDTSGRYDYLGESERDYIREIVLDTKPEARERWNATDADLAPDRRAESSPSDATPAPSSEDEAR
ncbi:MAG TPA: hypothetical protein VK116_09710, partial [Planctomycetota bacterium]|nr:hypothetical protein [Planctomycetota bacterium]